MSATLGAADQRVIDDSAYTQPQQLVTIEPGRRLNLFCRGKGAPVVVFDAGLGDSTKAWALVQPEIAKRTTACSYDRAGLGFSDASAAPGTSANAVKDLQRLLRAAKLPAPFVLVGHSYGGMNVKLYTETFPQDVMGMVLVDPSHEDLGREVGALDPPSDVRHLQYLEDLKRCLSATPILVNEYVELAKLCIPRAGPRYSDEINAVELRLGAQPERMKAWISEMTHVWAESADQVRAAYRNLGDMPIVVLTKTPSSPVRSETVELRQAKNDVWIRLHSAIAAMSSRGTRLTVEGSGHYIQHDQPQPVVDAINRVLEESSVPRMDER